MPPKDPTVRSTMGILSMLSGPSPKITSLSSVAFEKLIEVEWEPPTDEGEL